VDSQLAAAGPRTVGEVLAALIFGGGRAGVVSVRSGVPVTHIWALTRGITSFARLCQNFYHKLKRRGALPTCNFDTVFSRGAHPKSND